jgi:hypothetical protein
MRHGILVALPLVFALGAADPSVSPSARPEAGAPESAAPWIPPEEASPKPKQEEWAKAEPLDLPRKHLGCRASRIREWVRVACTTKYKVLMGARIVGGSHEDVSLEPPLVKRPPRKQFEPHESYNVDVVFPVRRGDRRLIEIPEEVSAGFKSYSIHEIAVFTISELWLPGDSAPTITVH